MPQTASEYQREREATFQAARELWGDMSYYSFRFEQIHNKHTRPFTRYKREDSRFAPTCAARAWVDDMTNLGCMGKLNRENVTEKELQDWAIAQAFFKAIKDSEMLDELDPNNLPPRVNTDWEAMGCLSALQLYWERYLDPLVFKFMDTQRGAVKAWGDDGLRAITMDKEIVLKFPCKEAVNEFKSSTYGNWVWKSKYWWFMHSEEYGWRCKKQYLDDYHVGGKNTFKFDLFSVLKVLCMDYVNGVNNRETTAEELNDGDEPSEPRLYYRSKTVSQAYALLTPEALAPIKALCKELEALEVDGVGLTMGQTVDALKVRLTHEPEGSVEYVKPKAWVMKGKDKDGKPVFEMRSDVHCYIDFYSLARYHLETFGKFYTKAQVVEQKRLNGFKLYMERRNSEAVEARRWEKLYAEVATADITKSDAKNKYSKEYFTWLCEVAEAFELENGFPLFRTERKSKLDSKVAAIKERYLLGYKLTNTERCYLKSHKVSVKDWKHERDTLVN